MNPKPDRRLAEWANLRQRIAGTALLIVPALSANDQILHPILPVDCARNKGGYDAGCRALISQFEFLDLFFTWDF